MYWLLCSVSNLVCVSYCLDGEQVNVIELMVTEGLVEIRVGGKQSE